MGGGRRCEGFLLCSCGGGSFRSGMQSPTGAGGRGFRWMGGGRRCEGFLLCSCGGGSFRSGMQSPTGAGGGGFVGWGVVGVVKVFCYALAGVDRSGRGFNPRPAPGRPAKFNSRSAPGRPAKFNPRPASGRTAQIGSKLGGKSAELCYNMLRSFFPIQKGVTYPCPFVFMSNDSPSCLRWR